jgi:hypothetical protein
MGRRQGSLLRIAVTTVLAFLSLPHLRANEPAGTLKPMSLQVGFTKYAFASVNRNDAEAAFKVFAQAISQRRSYTITPTTRVFEDASDFEPEIKAGRIDLVIIDAWRYLSMDTQLDTVKKLRATHDQLCPRASGQTTNPREAAARAPVRGVDAGGR